MELLGRNEEAIVEYLFVTENARSQVWHDLAMMHLEPVDL